jgi:hypothetical protein
MNCTFIQGYYIAKPMTAEKLEQLLMGRYADTAPKRTYTPIKDQKNVK